ncbi:MAG: hypothetical protein ACOYN4_06490 [Bacteroidales bacterium]
MPYTAFETYFPEIAEKETRVIQFFEGTELAGDTLILIEMFCDEPKCDCRRVMLNVFSEKRKEFVAAIAFGWENERFYKKWYPYGNENDIKELKGPALNAMSRTTDISEIVLKSVTELVLSQQNYIDRVKEHYYIFRKHIE